MRRHDRACGCAHLCTGMTERAGARCQTADKHGTHRGQTWGTSHESTTSRERASPARRGPQHPRTSTVLRATRRHRKRCAGSMRKLSASKRRADEEHGCGLRVPCRAAHLTRAAGSEIEAFRSTCEQGGVTVSAARQRGELRAACRPRRKGRRQQGWRCKQRETRCTTEHAAHHATARRNSARSARSAAARTTLKLEATALMRHKFSRAQLRTRVN